jgi:hypothetical protein
MVFSTPVPNYKNLHKITYAFQENEAPAKVLTKTEAAQITRRSWLTKTIDSLRAVINQGIFILRNNVPGLISHWKTPKSEQYNISQDQNWKENSNGLVVLLHGLNSHPAVWHGHVSTMKKDTANYGSVDLRTPLIPKKGNCTVSESLGPIENMIRNYARNHPDKPICVLGVSNGGRLAAHLSHKLQDLDNPLLFSGIASVLNGTQHPIFQNESFDPEIKKDYIWADTEAAELIKKMATVEKTNRLRESIFYTSTEDPLVYPWYGSIPFFKDQNNDNYYCKAQGHSSIVGHVKRHQLAKVSDFITANQQPSSL